MQAGVDTSGSLQGQTAGSQQFSAVDDTERLVFGMRKLFRHLDDLGKAREMCDGFDGGEVAVRLMFENVCDRAG